MSQQLFTSSCFSSNDDFDCSIVDAKTRKAWKAENRRKNLRDMREYLKLFPDATTEEKIDLKNWVNSGHSPFENGDYISTESGQPMDFINAARFLESLVQEHLNEQESIHEESNNDLPVFYDDLPF